MAYTTTAICKESLSIPSSVSSEDAAIGRAISAAESEIDSYAGRTFEVPTGTAVRTYTASDPSLCIIDDLAKLNDLVVKTDDDDDGSFSTTLTLTSQYIATGNAAPYRYIQNVDNGFPISQYGRPTVQVTGWFGYSMTVPSNVEQAATLLACRLYERRASPLGIVAGFEGDSLRISHKDPDMRTLLNGFRLLSVA